MRDDRGSRVRRRVPITDLVATPLLIWIMANALIALLQFSPIGALVRRTVSDLIYDAFVIPGDTAPRQDLMVLTGMIILLGTIVGPLSLNAAFCVVWAVLRLRVRER